MKVHELVECYKKIIEDAQKDHEESLKRIRRDTAYLQSLDPNMDVGRGVWSDYPEWKEKHQQ